MSSASAPGGPLAPVLRARLRSLRNTTVAAVRRHPRGAIATACAITIAAVTAAVIVALATENGRHQVSSAATAGILTLLVGFTAVTSLTFALTSLYFARDLEFLHSSPIAPRTIIASRIWTQLGVALGVGAALAGVPLIAYTAVSGHFWAAPLVGATILALVAIPLSIATAIVVAGVRLVPARLARAAGGLVVTVAVFVVAAVNVFLRGPSAIASKPASIPFEAIGRGWPGTELSPMGWAARAVTAAVHGDIAQWWAWSVPVLVVATAAVLSCGPVLADAYSTGYERTLAAGSRQRRRQAGFVVAARPDRPVWMVLALKDLREIRRDASQMGQLLLPLALFALYLGSPTAATSAPAALPGWYLVALNATFGSLLFAANIALRGVGTEGQRLWLLRVTPTRSRDVLTAKYVAGFVVAAAPAFLLFWIGAWRARISPGDIALASLWITCMMATVVAVAVGFGSTRPRLDWTDPRRAVGIGTTLLFLLTGASYLVSGFIVLGAPYAFGRGALPAVLAGAFVMVVWSGSLAAAAMHFGVYRFAALEM